MFGISDAADGKKFIRDLFTKGSIGFLDERKIYRNFKTIEKIER